MYEKLNNDNFLLFAAKFYENPSSVGQKEFEEDLCRIKYIKRLFKKHEDGGELRERLILNHLIILYNVFYYKACTRMLCYKLYDSLGILKPFLMYLNYWPEDFKDEVKNIKDNSIKLDDAVIKKLRTI